MGVQHHTLAGLDGKVKVGKIIQNNIFMVLEINMDRFPLAPDIYSIVHWMEGLTRLKYFFILKKN